MINVSENIADDEIDERKHVRWETKLELIT